MSTFPPNEIPKDVIERIRALFAQCNRTVSADLSRNPGSAEEFLDMSWLVALQRNSAPVALGSKWVVGVETHFLGGRRHYQNWEVADIGVVLHIRLPGQEFTKVVLLQSKRLYPTTGKVREETPGDYRTGFARLADPEDRALTIASPTEYRFAEGSRYKALTFPSAQASAIQAYQRDRNLKVYYQFYNPWTLPLQQEIPTLGYPAYNGDPQLGIRVIPSDDVHDALKPTTSSGPRIADLNGFARVPTRGWRLEDFMSDEVLACREGDLFDSRTAEPLETLFYSRSGPISAAVAITIESPQYAG